MSDLANAALAEAVKRIGISENPNTPNSGPEVDLYLASVGKPAGLSWCAAFVYYCFKEASNALGVVNPCPCSSGVLWTWIQARINYQISESPLPGDVYVLKHGDHSGHMGFVENVENGMVASEVSGNTFGDKGGREGNCVARHFGRPEVTHGGLLLGYLRF